MINEKVGQEPHLCHVGFHHKQYDSNSSVERLWEKFEPALLLCNMIFKIIWLYICIIAMVEATSYSLTSANC